jgi:hypothetical protein
MNAFLTKFVAVSSALIVALPTGFCCTPAQVEASATHFAAEGDHDCCRDSTPARPAKSHERAPGRNLACCCSHAAIIAKTGGSNAPVVDFAVLSIIDDLSPEQRPDPSPVNGGATSGPLLHIILCVWRC